MASNSNVICSITKEAYTYPVVLPECLHTFDKHAIDKVSDKVCPECKTEFTRTDRVDWVIAKLRGLNIEAPVGETLAQNSLYASDKGFGLRAYDTLKDIKKGLYETISNECAEGRYKIALAMDISTYSFSMLITDDILIKNIINEVQADGYVITINKRYLDKLKIKVFDINISWCSSV